MPNIKSAKKRVKVIATKTLQNKTINSRLKTEIKRANAAIENNEANKAEEVKAAIKDDRLGKNSNQRTDYQPNQKNQQKP